LAAWDKAHPDQPAAPFAINQIVHKSNDRLEQDLQVCARYKVPMVITSLGARTDVNHAVHGWGGVVMHDIINNAFAHKAIEKGADGLIAVAAGAGGHAGVKSPFALVQEIRQWFSGPLALSGAIATGGAVLACQAMGADFAYIGSAFIATDEARASDAYKQCVVDSNSDDIVYSNLFTGVHGNYLKASVRAAGLDPDRLPESDPSADELRRRRRQEGLEGHLGLRPGHRCGERRGTSRRTGGPAGTRVRGGTTPLADPIGEKQKRNGACSPRFGQSLGRPVVQRTLVNRASGRSSERCTVVTPAFIAQGRIWWCSGISRCSSRMRTSASRISALRLATSVSVFIASVSGRCGSLILLKLKLPSAPVVRVRTSDWSVYCAS
jgi:NAD(P)H-dependent flavin oxidoreductase YrpB (nitropropane dioxygenase family)